MEVGLHGGLVSPWPHAIATHLLEGIKSHTHRRGGPHGVAQSKGPRPNPIVHGEDGARQVSRHLHPEVWWEGRGHEGAERLLGHGGACVVAHARGSFIENMRVQRACAACVCCVRVLRACAART